MFDFFEEMRINKRIAEATKKKDEKIVELENELSFERFKSDPFWLEKFKEVFGASFGEVQRLRSELDMYKTRCITIEQEDDKRIDIYRELLGLKGLDDTEHIVYDGRVYKITNVATEDVVGVQKYIAVEATCVGDAKHFTGGKK